MKFWLGSSGGAAPAGHTGSIELRPEVVCDAGSGGRARCWRREVSWARDARRKGLLHVTAKNFITYKALWRNCRFPFIFFHLFIFLRCILSIFIAAFNFFCNLVPILVLSTPEMIVPSGMRRRSFAITEFHNGRVMDESL